MSYGARLAFADSNGPPDGGRTWFHRRSMNMALLTEGKSPNSMTTLDETGIRENLTGPAHSGALTKPSGTC